MKPKRANTDNHPGRSTEPQDLENPPGHNDQDSDAAAGTERISRTEDSHFLALSQVEPFVRPEIVAEYIGIDAATVVRFATYGILPGHPLRESGKRLHWRFLLSEVRRSMLSKTGERVLRNVRKEAQSKAKGS
jgi:hypothetical protein